MVTTTEWDLTCVELSSSTCDLIPRPLESKGGVNLGEMNRLIEAQDISDEPEILDMVLQVLQDHIA